LRLAITTHAKKTLINEQLNCLIKTLAIDPENGYAKQSVEMLKDKK
jgi:hypothetical protein